MRVSVVIFPGSNCDHDAIHAYGAVLGQEVKTVWHKDSDLGKPDAVILPGGFAYGDYLRTGALAKLSPVMSEVIKFANGGGPVLGICNGFQILCESGLLPGVLLRNIRMKFLSQFVHIKIENDQTVFTKGQKRGAVVTCPIAHAEGNYFADAETIKELEAENRVVFRYCAADGRVDPIDQILNPNGAVNAIAGVCNKGGNVVGLMPHPERAIEKIVGGVGQDSGLQVIRALAA